MDPKAFFQLSYGVYLLSTHLDGQDNGCIINTACQVTSSPLQLSVTVNKENLTCQMIRESGHFAVHVLTENAHMEFIGRMGFKSGRDVKKFAGMEISRSLHGDPILLDSPEAGAVFACRVVNSMDVGTHMLFVAEVEDACVTGFKPPMTYAYYHQVKKGTTPPKASSFVPSEKKEESKGPKWRCTVCGHIHEGEEPPEKCPVCGQGKEKFEKIS